MNNEWQKIDPETGLCFPWYTHPALDVIKTWNVKGLRVFEYGAGASTVWWRAKGAIVKGVDNNEAYAFEGIKYTQDHQSYIETPYWDEPFDIIIVDGEPIEWRDDCIRVAIESLKFGGRLIVDNWCQKSVGWMPSAGVQELVNDMPRVIHKQPNHADWNTVIAWNR